MANEPRTYCVELYRRKEKLSNVKDNVSYKL